jgi:hypothetical protein
MKKLSLALIAVSLAVPAHADHWVNGYTRRDGTYVQGHMQSDPNGTKLDNYSTRGNVNPYTSQPGTRDPYAVPSTPTYHPYRAPTYTPLYTPPAPSYSPPAYQPHSYSYSPPVLQPLPCVFCSNSDDGDGG